MVQNLMFLKDSQIIYELCRYCPLSSILPFWPLLHLFDICYLNHSVSYYLKCVNRIPNSNQFFVSVFHLGYSKYLVKSVYSRRVTWLLLVGLEEKDLFDWFIIYVGYFTYLRKRFIISIEISPFLVTKNNNQSQSRYSSQS